MTLTLDLPPQIEQVLLQRAESTGQDVASLALAVLAFGLSFDDRDFMEALEGIQRGLEDFDQGKFSSFDEFIKGQKEKHGLALDV